MKGRLRSPFCILEDYMDPSVVAAMAKWPNVPDCHGWLSLDRRGQWRLQGKVVSHTGLVEFIGRNYLRHVSGAWYMQNGPQRVWVTLELTPWVYRLDSGCTLLTHTNQAAKELHKIWLVDGEVLCLMTEWGLGVVDDRDLTAFLNNLHTASGQLTDGDLKNLDFTLNWNNQTLTVHHCHAADLQRLGDFQAQATAPSSAGRCPVRTGSLAVSWACS